MLRETVPIAAILAIWHVAALVLARAGTGGALRLAGLTMAGLYVVVRGIALGTQNRSDTVSFNLADTVRENVWVLVVAGVWFLLVQALWWGLLIVPVVSGLEEEALARWVADVLNWTGVGAVLLYAVVAASTRLPTIVSRSRPGGDGDDSAPSGDA